MLPARIELPAESAASWQPRTAKHRLENGTVALVVGP
jgi:hypothetical protein